MTTGGAIYALDHAGNRYGADNINVFSCSPDIGGDFPIGPGETVTACLSVPMPNGKRIAEVRESPPFSGATAAWNVHH